jgi:glycosyltransferase involved in cell wall biosynthesis
VGIYNEPAEGGIGGAEISVAVLAEALARDHQVEIVHHKPDMLRERLAEISGTNLSAVRMRPVAQDAYSFGSMHDPRKRYNEASNWHADLSEPYDLFINFTHGFPPFCHARRGALVVLFPFHDRPHMEQQDQSPTAGSFPLWKRLKTIYHEWEWRKRLDSYQIKTTISQFSHAWTIRRWGIDCEIVYPPAATTLQPGIKKNMILSVGRFAATGHSKKQLEMITAFRELQKSAPSDLEYFSIGGVSDARKDLEYFQKVSRLAEDCGAHAIANIERSRLKQLYGQAGIFWHAAGYGEDENRPEQSEHFGMATVEAMSAGCIPVVINKGGQPEIVQHDISGFVWSTLEELKYYTELLMRNERLRAQMAEAARARAALFSRERFLGRFLPLLQE